MSSTELPAPAFPGARGDVSPGSGPAMDRALLAVEAGEVPTVAAASVLLAARGEDLVRLSAAAARVRDAGLAAAGLTDGARPIVTYSRKVFIPLTYLCRDRCHYCTFVSVPGKLRAEGKGMYLEGDEVLAIATAGAAMGCKEALFTLGDRPEDRWPEAAEWLAARGFSSTLDYVRAMAVRVLTETGLLPHLNPGVLSAAELAWLRPVAPSMGMMLETTSRRLFTERGQAHYGSPDKDPAVRLAVLDAAGRAQVPFTTGILVGIGESLADRAESIVAIADSHRRHGHIQEVIVQNFRAKPDTAMRLVPDAEMSEFLAAVAVTRLVMGPDMRIQAPPNLVSPEESRALLDAGIDDWGGVSPLTPDHVNPERPWPNIAALEAICANSGFTLRERLTTHARYVRDAMEWVDPAVRPHLAALAEPESGLAVGGRRPVGQAWRGPDGGHHRRAG